MSYSRQRHGSFSLPPNYLLNYNSNHQLNQQNNSSELQIPNSPPSSIDSFSDSDSPPSTISYGSSVASSLTNSPSLLPSPISNNCHIPDLSLSPNNFISPSNNDLTHYASTIIRNEAYALLALADRLNSNGPILDNSDSSSSSSFEIPFQVDPISNQSSPMDQDQVMSGGEDSRTNIAFRGVFGALKSLPAHGKVLVTGVGKSGIVAKKMVATFNSLGIPSVFLHPLEALHGDLGVVCHCNPLIPCDALLLISHSGATAELMRLIPIVRSRVRSLIAVTRDPDSVLARSCTNWLDAGTGSDCTTSTITGEKSTDEADSELPAPTSSVICGLAIGDALALCLSKNRVGWEAAGSERRKEFFQFHPGGQLGLVLSREARTTTTGGLKSI